MGDKIMTIMFAASSGAFYFSEYSKWLSVMFLVMSLLASIGYFNMDNKKSVK